ncbi:hypothetical protein GEV27_05970 [Aeromicrobium sp. S22]|uniref:carboxypeptidase regulatory-like domain-containing protein n=1 Tax=Aeromicrobium sp. S22 TaxID=2662029 RepID=UPI00129E7948|nr:carboxypeptidase regulatory-like domain-containing protein [Aeromicrobium sp. S22]MRK01064.1 hypothetical protein [Aeromicrobium sp. S22]
MTFAAPSADTSTPRRRRLSRLTGVLVAACLAGAGLTAQPAQADDTGSLTGAVFTQSVGGPKTTADGGYLYLYRWDPADERFASVDADPSDDDTDAYRFDGGTYTLPNLPAGSYTFEVHASPAYQSEYYNDAFDVMDATTLQVGSGTTVADDVVLEVSGQITGRVTDRAGKPLANASIMFRRSEMAGGTTVRTDADGVYSSVGMRGGGLVRGTYKVEASVHADKPDDPSYESRYWKNSTTFAGAADVAVTPGKTTDKIDIALDQAPRIRLTVKDPAGNPVPDAAVGVWQFYEGEWGPRRAGPNETDDAGVYRQTVRIGDRYKFFFTPPAGVDGVTEWYDNAYSEAAAKEVTATSHGEVIDIEIKLGPAPAVAGSTPTITGTPQVGQQLTADPGTWGPAGVELAYQWLANGAPIEGATQATYTPSIEDATKTIAVRVTGTLAHHTTTAKTSAATAPVSKPAVAGSTPTITGTPQVGQQLTADPGTWGPAGVELAYQWLANGAPIEGATQATYTPSIEDATKTIAVRVTGTLAHHTTTAKTSAATAPVSKPAVAGSTPTITGTPQVGQQLTADPGTWGPAGVELAYQWLANGAPIEGATQATYTPSIEDATKTITVRVTGTLATHTATTKTSAATAPVATPPVVTGAAPTISGTPRSGKTLSVATGSWGPAGVTLARQWRANGAAITGATGSTLRLSNAHAGKKITVTVTGTIEGGAPVVRTSAATAKVQGVLTAKKVTISGTAKVGRTLRAKTGSWGPAPVTSSYKWYRNGRAISGQKKSTYKVRKADVGKRITVRVTQRKSSYVTVSKLSSKTAKVKKK